MARRPPGLVYAENERPPLPALAALGLQHIFLMSSTLVLPVVLVSEIGGSFSQVRASAAASRLRLGISLSQPLWAELFRRLHECRMAGRFAADARDDHRGGARGSRLRPRDPAAGLPLSPRDHGPRGAHGGGIPRAPGRLEISRHRVRGRAHLFPRPRRRRAHPPHDDRRQCLGSRQAPALRCAHRHDRGLRPVARDRSLRRRRPRTARTPALGGPAVARRHDGLGLPVVAPSRVRHRVRHRRAEVHGQPHHV